MHIKNRLKLGVFRVIVSIFFVAILVYMYLDEVKYIIVEQNKVHAKEVTTQIAMGLDKKIESRINNLDTITNILVSSENTTKDKLDINLNAWIESMDFSEIIIVDTDGKGVDNKDRYIDISKKDYFKSAMNGNIVISEPTDLDIYNEEKIIYSLPINNDGKIVGVICGIVNSDLAKEQLEISIYNGKGYFHIINEDGNIIFKENIELYKKSNKHLATQDKIFQNKFKNKKSDTDVIVRNIDEKSEYIGYAKINSANWYVVTEIPVEDVFLDSKKIIRTIGYILYTFLFIIIIMYFKASKCKKENKIQLNKAVYEDHLTEINNYEKFIIDGENYLKERDRLRCVMISFDVQKFNIMNNIYGYQFGDEILKRISKNLRQKYMDKAVYGRLTRDIFGLLIEVDDTNSSTENLVSIINNEIVTLENMEIFNMSIDIKPSIGIYFIQDNEDKDLKCIVDSADIARIKSKKLNQNNYMVFDIKMREEKILKMEIENDLIHSIDKNQFQIYYQPQFNIKTMEIIGAEALIRWIHPTRGIISPMMFIPLAERNGFINEIGRWVFNEVCRSLRSLIDEGIEVVPVSVNLSRVELYQENLINFLSETLKKYNIPSNLVHIEITETTALNDMDFISNKIEQIKLVGMKISMDDFGVGNSNLGNLKDMPIDILKIDRSLLVDIETNIKTKVVAQNIVTLSNDLNLEIICEGIENMEQVEILKQMGCSIVQGYVFFRPINSDEYKKILVNKNHKKGAL